MTATRRRVAIFYADVAGYSRLTGVDEAGTHSRVMALLDDVTARIGAAGGTVLRYAGKRITLGADKAYDVKDFAADLRQRKVTPHVAQNDHLTKTGKQRTSAIDRRTTRHPGYQVSQRCRKRIEEIFGWIKSSAGFSKVKLRGRERVDATFTLAVTAYNLIRLPKLLEAPA